MPREWLRLLQVVQGVSLMNDEEEYQDDEK